MRIYNEKVLKNDGFRCIIDLVFAMGMPSIAMRRAVLLNLIACFALFAGQSWAANVQDFRIWAGPDKTRAVLDLDKEVDYQIFTLDNPSRVVIDLKRSELTGDIHLPEDRSSGYLKRVRHGIRAQDNLRVVFDLAEAAKPKSFLLAPAGEHGHRLVIDLFPESGGAVIEPPPTWNPNPERDVIVAIDAGHGGDDPGAIGPRKTQEKRITLAIAKELNKELNEMPGIQSFLVREGDYYIAHKERYEIARRKRADLFVSIHADSFHSPKPSGSSVYILSRRGATSEAAQRLAEGENRSDLIGGVRLDDKDDVLASVLMDLSQSATLESSNDVADAILTSLKQIGKVHKRRVERANFAVLRSPDVPSVLVETAFMSNPNEEKRLNDPAHQRRLAKAISLGIHDHFHTVPPPGTWIANHRQPSRHVVSRGDTLGAIATRYQVSVDRLRQINKLNTDTIRVGAVLVIPST